MYPTLSHFLQDIFGVNIPLPVQMFGLFLVLALLGSLAVVTAEFKRKEKEGKLFPIPKTIVEGEKPQFQDFIFPLILGFLLGFKGFYAVSHYSDFVNDTQNFLLSKQGNFLGGIFISLLWAGWNFYQKKKQQLSPPRIKNIEVLPHKIVPEMFLIILIFSLLGAKIFHHLENLGEFLNNPVDSFFSFGGLTFYGGFIFTTTALFYFARKNKIPFVQMVDVAAIAIPVGYGIGRMGCHVSGDGDWGIVAEWSNIPSFLPEWFWQYRYPNNVINAGIPIWNCEGNFCNVLPHPVYPTPLWESIISLLTAGILFLLRRKITKPTLLFSIYLIAAGISRFFIEKIRINPTYEILNFNISQAQIIAICSIFLGISGIIIIFRKNFKL